MPPIAVVAQLSALLLMIIKSYTSGSDVTAINVGMLVDEVSSPARPDAALHKLLSSPNTNWTSMTCTYVVPTLPDLIVVRDLFHSMVNGAST